jgi:hypothetical protein
MWSQLNVYPEGSIDSVLCSKGDSGPNKEETPLGSVCIKQVMVVSEKLERIGNR